MPNKYLQIFLSIYLGKRIKIARKATSKSLFPARITLKCPSGYDSNENIDI